MGIQATLTVRGGEMDLTRQKDLISEDKLGKTKILLVGAGGIGSFVAQTLCKMGVQHIQIWDKDRIEEHNIPNQNFKPKQQGEFKVHALMDNIAESTEAYPETKTDFWTGDFEYDPDILITAVDSMTIRYELWEAIQKAKKGMWVLDARMSSRSMSMYTCRIGNEESMVQYAKHGLFPSDEADKEPCTAKSIIHTCQACAYMVGNAVHEILSNEKISSAYFGDLLHFHLTKTSVDVV